MNESHRSSAPDAKLRRWRCFALFCSLTTGLCVLLLTLTTFLAAQDLNTHYNLYYLLWKAGIRRYEPAVALGGLFHDLTYRQRFVGMPTEQFMRVFPGTFYQVRKRPPILKPNQELYITDYAQAESGDIGAGWEVTFEDGRVIEFDFGKG